MNADRLIQEYKKNGHPLGDELRQEEADELIVALRKRLDATDDELNLAPYSLKRLEEKLRGYHQHLQESGQPLSDDDTVRLVREIAAYFGMVCIKHAGATWRGGRSLWDTGIEVAGPIKVIDGSQRFSGPRMVMGLGNHAASAWDGIAGGWPMGMYSSYLAMRKKVSKQDLRPRR